MSGSLSNPASSQSEEHQLHAFARRGDVENVRRLLANNNSFDINALTLGYLFETALHAAVRGGHVDIVKEMMELGSMDLDVVNEEGDTPLHLGCSKGYVNIVYLLLESGADPNVFRQCDGAVAVCPLHIAAEAGNVDITKLLIQFGADWTIKSSDNLTALEYAKALGSRTGDHHVESLLLAVSGSPTKKSVFDVGDMTSEEIVKSMPSAYMKSPTDTFVTTGNELIPIEQSMSGNFIMPGKKSRAWTAMSMIKKQRDDALQRLDVSERQRDAAVKLAKAKVEVLIRAEARLHRYSEEVHALKHENAEQTNTINHLIKKVKKNKERARKAERVAEEPEILTKKLLGEKDVIINDLQYDVHVLTEEKNALDTQFMEEKVKFTTQSNAYEDNIRELKSSLRNARESSAIALGQLAKDVEDFHITMANNREIIKGLEEKTEASEERACRAERDLSKSRASLRKHVEDDDVKMKAIQKRLAVLNDADIRCVALTKELDEANKKVSDLTERIAGMMYLERYKARRLNRVAMQVGADLQECQYKLEESEKLRYDDSATIENLKLKLKSALSICKAQQADIDTHCMKTHKAYLGDRAAFYFEGNNFTMDEMPICETPSLTGSMHTPSLPKLPETGLSAARLRNDFHVDDMMKKLEDLNRSSISRRKSFHSLKKSTSSPLSRSETPPPTASRPQSQEGIRNGEPELTASSEMNSVSVPLKIKAAPFTRVTSVSSQFGFMKDSLRSNANAVFSKTKVNGVESNISIPRKVEQGIVESVRPDSYQVSTTIVADTQLKRESHVSTTPAATSLVSASFGSMKLSLSNLRAETFKK